LEVFKLDEIIKNSILTFLALVVFIGGSIISLIFSIVLFPDQYGIYISMPIMAITLALFWLILARADPDSLNNPFT